MRWKGQSAAIAVLCPLQDFAGVRPIRGKDIAGIAQKDRGSIDARPLLMSVEGDGYPDTRQPCRPSPGSGAPSPRAREVGNELALVRPYSDASPQDQRDASLLKVRRSPRPARTGRTVAELMQAVACNLVALETTACSGAMSDPSSYSPERGTSDAGNRAGAGEEVLSG